MKNYDISKNFGIIIQVRGYSIRLNNKTILEIEKEVTVLSVLLSKLKLLNIIITIILAKANLKFDYNLRLFA